LRTSAKTEVGSERTCIVTGEKDSPEAMLRFALGPDGSVVPDLRRELPGRGVWTRLSLDTVRRAAERGAFSRAFRAHAVAAKGLEAKVDTLLERETLQALSMANKAGLVVTGAFKVDSASDIGAVAVLIRASDGAADGAAKREGALRARLGDAADAIPRINLFSSSQLDLALGKANVIHAALKSGAATSAFLARAERLRRYRSISSDTASKNKNGGAPETDAVGLGRPDGLAEGQAIRNGHERNEQ
jgi:uncharacterized protein